MERNQKESSTTDADRLDHLTNFPISSSATRANCALCQPFPGTRDRRSLIRPRHYAFTASRPSKELCRSAITTVLGPHLKHMEPTQSQYAARRTLLVVLERWNSLCSRCGWASAMVLKTSAASTAKIPLVTMAWAERCECRQWASSVWIGARCAALT